jgi:hypothetical protein
MSLYNQLPIQIVPCEMVTTIMATGFTFDVSEFIPNTSATFRVVVYSEQGQKKIKTIKLEGQAYLDWGNDDDYIIQYIATQLGCTLA